MEKDDDLEFVDLDNEFATRDDEKVKERAVVESVKERTFVGDIGELLKYFLAAALTIIFFELIMATKLGGINLQGMFMLFFVPAEAMLLASLCGIGSDKSARILFPIILLIPSAFYVAQIVYYVTFGSLISVSLMGMGNEAVGGFAWTLGDVLKRSLPYLIVIFIAIVAVIVITATDVIKLKKYRLSVHLIALVMTIVLWGLGLLSIRAFGTDRLSPYSLLTSASATTDTVAKKVGVMTTTIVESGSYFLGIGLDENNDFAEEIIEEEDIDDVDVVKVSDVDAVEEEVEESVSSPWVNPAIDFSEMTADAGDSDFEHLAKYFAGRKPSTTNEYTGMFEGYNLIYICAESFWSYACNEKVTPTLYKMAHNGIVLDNYYNSFNNTTTNGEFAFDTSLWPDVSRFSKNGTDIGSFAQSSTKYMPQGLGDLFTAQGIPSYAFHNYYGKYYRRILSWPNLGYKCRFTGDGMWFTSNWPASDLELMEQTVDDYINDEQFHAYYMTFSGHGPYTAKNYMYNKNIAEVNALTEGDNYNDMARGYLAGELELDKAMEYLLKRLEEAGRLDKTVIVLTSDHYPYYLDTDARDSLVGYQMDETFDIYKSTCIIYNAAITEPIVVDDYCCNIDIAPTMLNLFNIPFESRLMIGRDIFSQESHKRAVLYNKNFISDKVRYNYETGEADWTIEGNKLTQEEKDRYLNNQLNSIENEYMASCKMIDNNFFLKVYEKAGLLSASDVSDEIAREKSAQSQDDTFNVEDEEEKARKEAEKAAAAAAAAQAEEERLLQEQLNALMMMQNGGVIDGQIPDMGIVNQAPADQIVMPPVVEQPAVEVVPQ